MFPIHDDNPTLRTPLVTLLLIGMSVGAWLFVQGAGMDQQLTASVCRFGLIPAELLSNPEPRIVAISPDFSCRIGDGAAWKTLLSSMFMHGGWFHLIGNMWFLWIFGNNVEDSMGRLRFAAFYVLCGLGAAMAQAFVDPGSVVPMVGASGAIGGVMGAYVVLYPRVAVTLLVFLGFFITTVRVPAFLMLGYWFILQLLGGLPQLAETQGGVAFWAHVGGFVSGVVLIFPFRNNQLVDRHRRELRRVTSDGRS
jgi:membrane associated rhomboid family serine protease